MRAVCTTRRWNVMTDWQPQRKNQRDQSKMRIRQRAEDGPQSDFVVIKVISYLARPINVRGKTIQYLQRHLQRGGRRRRRGRMWAGVLLAAAGPISCRSHGGGALFAQVAPHGNHLWAAPVKASAGSALSWVCVCVLGGDCKDSLLPHPSPNHPSSPPSKKKSYFLL